MNRNASVLVGAVVAAGCVMGGGCAHNQESPDRDAGPARAEDVKMRGTVGGNAKGSFDVKLTAQPLHEALSGEEGSMLGRMSIDKQFHGDLEATSKGEMLSAGTSVKGSAGYVAIERVSGVLDGMRGTFVLQHSGTMKQGTMPRLELSVVPDSGTGELVGLAGTMMIHIVEKKHTYEFVYVIEGSR